MTTVVTETVVTDTATAPAPTLRSTWCLIAFVAATLALGFLYQTKTAPSAADALDASWMAVLGHDLVEGRQFGVDTVFTYGVLGYFVAGDTPYIPALFTITLIMRLLLGIGAAAVLLAARRAVKPWPLQVIGLAALVVFAPCQRELVHVAAIGLLPAAFAVARRITLPALAAAGLYAVALALGKHTLLFASAVSLACTLAIVAHRRGARTALAAALIFAAEFFCVWIFAFQDPRNLPAYFVGAWDSVRGYADAMGVPEPVERHWLTVGTGMALGLTCFAGLAARLRDRRDFGGACATIAILAAGALATKLGVTRADDGHRVVANGVLFALALAATPDGSRLGDVFRGVAIAGATVGFFMASQNIGYSIERIPAVVQAHVLDVTRETLDPAATRAKHDELRKDLAKWNDLPELRARIGAEPVDLIGNAHGVLYLAGLNVRHRPVFQQYAAHTPELNARNAAFFDGPHAPKFVIARPDPIDGRPLTLADSASLRALLLRYRAVYAERGYALFEREAGGSPPPPRPARTFAVGFGDRVDLRDSADGLVEISIDVQPTLQGRIRGLIGRPAALWMVATLASGSERRLRISPELAATPFIVNPFVETTAALLDLQGHKARERVAAIRFEVEPGRERWVSPTLSVTIWSDEALWARLSGPPAIDVARSMQFPTFRRPPDVVEPPANVWALVEFGSPEGVLAHPQSTMTWNLGPGSWRASGRCGVVRKAWEEGKTDGVVFIVEVAAGDGTAPRELFRKSLAPRDHLLDRAEYAFDVPFDLASPGRLSLRTDPGPAGNPDWDWAYWRSIAIDQAK